MRKFLFCVFTLFFMGLAYSPVYAQQGGVLIRDTEIETSLRGWLKPVAVAAGMDPNNIRIILIQNSGVNAFVAGGQNIFLYTGLIIKADSAGEVLGVMAHELGHITGGHLVRKREDLENASYESVLGIILGLGAVIASGQGEAAGTLAGAGQSQALRRLYGASRVYESSADQAAMSFMNTASINPTGLLSFMHKLESDEILPQSQQSEYNRTHPLTRDRISALSDRVERSPNNKKQLPSQWEDQFNRLKAKILAFVSPAQIEWAYPREDQSVAARYARAIAAYKQNQTSEALQQIDGLLASEPNNPYFYELKGQVLKESGRLKESVVSYKKAIDLKPDAALIRIDLAHSLIESNGNLQQAIDELLRALRDEPRSSRAWRLLATAYGKQGDEPRTQLALAEEAFLRRDITKAGGLAQAALEGLPKGSRDALRARDIIAQSQNSRKTKDSGE